jgi:inorganic pyrophosphatase
MVNAVIETPRGSRNKLSFDHRCNLFKLSTMLPQGSTFPYDFGFVPSTLAPDGDPLDVLVLMEEPVPAGCLVEARVIGVIEAEQTETKKGKQKVTRNDRIVAVAEKSQAYGHLVSLKQMEARMLEQVQNFFIHYNQQHGKTFKVLSVGGPKRALKLVERSMQEFESQAKAA